MVLLIVLVTIYIISLAVCRLSMILLGESDSKITNIISIVPIINMVAAVILVLFFGVIIRDNNKEMKFKKSETTQNQGSKTL